jgi:hypothetical protein
MLTPSPFRPKLPVAQHNIQQSPLYRSAFKDDDSDPFLFDITTSWHETLWNDPLLDIMPSQDHGIDRLQVSSSSSSSLSPLTSKHDTSEHTQSFSARLETLTHTLHERILTAPVEEHSALVTQLVTWASALAQDPFSETLLPEASASEDAKDDNDSQITRESHEDDSKCSWVLTAPVEEHPASGIRSTSASVISSFDLLSINGSTLRVCKRCSYANPPSTLTCHVCFAALVKNPCLNVDEQIARNLQRKETRKVLF